MTTNTPEFRLTFTPAGPDDTCHWHGRDGECGRSAVQLVTFLEGEDQAAQFTFCARHQDIAGQIRRDHQSRHN